MYSKTNTCFNLTTKQVNGNNETFRGSLGRYESSGAILLSVPNRMEMPFLQGLPQGLTSERIEKFEHFTADESLVGEQCLVCMNDLEIGMEIVRLDCHVDHILCKVCVAKWFKNHKTCPTCRQKFN